MNLKNLKIRLHYVLPKHLITLLIGFLASKRMGKFTNIIIRKFIEFYNVNTHEMYGNVEDYATFNEFFSRPLKKNARPISEQADSIIFPADGTISQFGDLVENLQLQAKGHYFTTDALLGSQQDAELFRNGKFCTVYLSPTDYHRVHMPFTGKLLKMTHIPGELFSVNPLYVENIPELFSRNERVVCLFETAIGKMAVILVGATIVRSIATAWSGIVAPSKSGEITTTSYNKKDISFTKGEEIGKFMMGSTVICLFEKDKIHFNDDLQLTKHMLMGTIMATADESNSKISSQIASTKKITVVKSKTKTTKKRISDNNKKKV